MGIGFNPSKEGEKRAATLEDIKKMLNEEIASFQTFEKTLLAEYHKVEDLLTNLRLVEQQMDSIRQLSENRWHVVLRLFKQWNQRKQEVDIEKCKEDFDIINHIDAQLRPILNRALVEVQRLYVEDTHVLYQQSKENKNTMHEVDKRAREITNWLQEVNTGIGSNHEQLQKIYASLAELEQERLERKNTGKMAF